ncbi:MAG TPA: hypothetical protein VGN17_16075 [Bryobacteraceae bacterium]|jgi:hypothetical protein
MIAAPAKQSLVTVRHLTHADHRSRQYGGAVILEYLTELFASSPKEIFNRLDILAVLDAVRKDRDLFPEVAIRAAVKPRPRRGSPPN